MQDDTVKPDFTPDAEGTKLAAEQELQRRLDVLHNFIPAKPRRKRHYARTMARRNAQKIADSEWYNCGGKLKRRPNPDRARHLRSSWPLQYKCAILGWLQLIHGKENVKIEVPK